VTEPMRYESELSSILGRLARRMNRVERAAGGAPEFRQGRVRARVTTAPRSVTVQIEPVGEVPGMALMAHHVMPDVGDTVWCVRVGPSRWLFFGKQG
jgi:hypothetical protein